MQFGLCLPTFETIATRDAIVRAARLADDEGWDSVWVTDHVLMASDQPHPYGHIFEALSTLAFVAGMTRRVKLGTSIIVLPQRNPIVVAKEIATLDVLSQGRVLLGVAAGWNEREFAFLGVDFHQRAKRLKEYVAVMRALWTQPNPSFQGNFYRFSNTLFSPKPVQAHIPIWLGGNSDAAARRAARIGDGWHVTGTAPEGVQKSVDMIRPLLNNRAFTISVRSEVVLNGSLPIEFAGPDGTKRRRLGPTLADIIRGVEEYRAVGAKYMVFVLRDDDMAEMETHIKEIAREVLPRFQK